MFGDDPVKAVHRLLESLDEESATMLGTYYGRARELVAGLEEGLSYAMPCLKHRGKALISLVPTRAGFSAYPFSGWVVEQVVAAYDWDDYTKGSVHFSVARPLPIDMFDALVTTRLAEIEHGRPGRTAPAE